MAETRPHSTADADWRRLMPTDAELRKRYAALEKNEHANKIANWVLPNSEDPSGGQENTPVQTMKTVWTPLSDRWPAIGSRILLANEQWTVAAKVCYFGDVDSENRPAIFKRFEDAGAEMKTYDLARIFVAVFRVVGVHGNVGWNYQIYNATHWTPMPVFKSP